MLGLKQIRSDLFTLSEEVATLQDDVAKLGGPSETLEARFAAIATWQEKADMRLTKAEADIRYLRARLDLLDEHVKRRDNVVDFQLDSLNVRVADLTPKKKVRRVRNPR